MLIQEIPFQVCFIHITDASYFWNSLLLSLFAFHLLYYCSLECIMWPHHCHFFLSSEAFTEDDWKLVQLVLTLFRNILAVQGISVQQKSGGSASQFLFVRDRFLELLFQENVMDLILVLTQHVGGPCGYFRQDNLLLLETFHYLFKGQEPELIATQNVKNSQVGFFFIV